MNCLIDAFWDENYREIFRTQFVPSMCYQFTMINFMALKLSGSEHDDWEEILHYPMLGFTLMFIINQVLIEFK